VSLKIYETQLKALARLLDVENLAAMIMAI
jgi:hypothetical protein